MVASSHNSFESSYYDANFEAGVPDAMMVFVDMVGEAQHYVKKAEGVPRYQISNERFSISEMRLYVKDIKVEYPTQLRMYEA